MKKINFQMFFGLIIIGFFLIVGGVVLTSKLMAATVKDKDSYSLKLLGEANLLEAEGRELEKRGDFDEAITKYKAAAELDKRIYGSDKGRPLAALAEVYQKQGDFNKALEILKGLREFHPEHEYYKDWEQELLALTQYEQQKTPKPVLDYLEGYKEKYKKILPPIKYSFMSITPITTILRLYDTIGDYDAGIAYIDMILDWTYERHPDIKHVKDSGEAKRFMDKLDTDGKPFANWRGYKLLREYLLVREAFEQDKKEGTKGRATKALIQSDYFPW